MLVGITSTTRDNKSATGWVFTLSGGVISWADMYFSFHNEISIYSIGSGWKIPLVEVSFLGQMCISHSTMESAFIALVVAGKDTE